MFTTIYELVSCGGEGQYASTGGCDLSARHHHVCGGGGICEHGRVRSLCKACGGGGICEHGR
eukprot:647173-Hanusia_phi.AAC.1